MSGAESKTGSLGGRFDLLGEIGSGGSGTVHRARTREVYAGLRPGTEVAVKFLRQDRLEDPGARERLLSEGKLGSKLTSPYVARIYGVETLELMGMESTYLVMELVRGTSLRVLLERSGPVVEDLARRVGMDAARGLAALHAAGLVHRDIKPENLAATPGGEVKLMDLGLAAGFRSSAARRGGFAGSVAYGAPEVLQGRPATPRSDLYSLGVVLFEIATGHHPFAHHRDVDDLLHAHLHEAPPRASHIRPRVSAFLDELIGELMAKEPAARPARAEDVAETLRLGEGSGYWQERERQLPVLASRRRLRRMRRPAPAPFVGRCPERSHLDSCLGDARHGHGSALLVCGAEGVGRRRLLDESVSRWLEQPDPPLFLGGQAEPGVSAGRGLPFSRMLADWYLRGDRVDSPRVEDRLALRIRETGAMDDDEAVRLTSVLTGTASGHPPEVRADLLARAFLSITHNHLVVVRVNDADHLGTTGSLVLRRLIEEAGSHRLLVLITGSDQDVRFEGRRMWISGLPAAEFATFGRSLFRGEVSRGFLDRACTSLAGNPGNFIESLRHLVQRGDLEGTPGDLHGLRATEIIPAPPLLTRLERLVEGLPAEQRQVFHGAAVLGERFLIADLAAVCGQPDLRILEALSAFQSSIARVIEGAGRFRHPDYRRALLRGIPDASRAGLHRAAAKLLETQGAPVLQIGLHLSRAGEHEACLEPLLAGFEQLVARGSRRSSLRVLARIRVHLDAVPNSTGNRERRLRFSLLAARTLALTERAAKATQAYSTALRLAHELGVPSAAGEALTGMATLALEAGQFLTAQSLLERAHPTLEQRDRRMAAQALGVHARVLAYLGQTEEGLLCLRRALKANPPRDPLQLPHLLVERARLERLRFDFTQALKTLERAARLLRIRPVPMAGIRVQLYRGQILSELGAEGAMEQLRLALDGARRLSNPRVQAKALLYMGQHDLRHAGTDSARGFLLDAVHLATRAADRVSATHAKILLQDLGLPQDNLEQTVEQLGLPASKVAWLLGEGRRHRRGGRPEMQRVFGDEAADILAVASLPFFLHLEVLAVTGRAAAARELVAEIAATLPAGAARRRFIAQALSQL